MHTNDNERRDHHEKRHAADLAYRSDLLRALGETIEATPAAIIRYRLSIERALAEVEERIRRRTLVLGQLETSAR